jgi:hypothetical protein
MDCGKFSNIYRNGREGDAKDTKNQEKSQSAQRRRKEHEAI